MSSKGRIKMKIIIGAMKEELMPLVQSLNAQKVNDSMIEEYFVEKDQLVIAVTGIGPVNAAMGLSYLLTKYHDQPVEHILNIGTCGALNQTFNVGEVFFIDKALYLTANATGFGYAFGQIPSMPPFYQSAETLVKTFQSKLSEWSPKNCNLATSDLFIDSQETADFYLKNITIKIDLVEMESAAFFQTAYNFEIPIVGIKVISDVMGQAKSNESQFELNLAKSAELISQMVPKLL